MFRPLIKELNDDKLENWTNDPEGQVAYVLLCDQFSRICYKDSYLAYRLDHKAQTLINSLLVKNPNLMYTMKR